MNIAIINGKSSNLYDLLFGLNEDIVQPLSTVLQENQYCLSMYYTNEHNQPFKDVVQDIDVFVLQENNLLAYRPYWSVQNSDVSTRKFNVHMFELELNNNQLYKIVNVMGDNAPNYFKLMQCIRNSHHNIFGLLLLRFNPIKQEWHLYAECDKDNEQRLPEVQKWIKEQAKLIGANKFEINVV